MKSVDLSTFPETKYMGSKRAILGFLIPLLERLDFQNALDAFTGTSTVAYSLKKLGKRTTANDFLRFAYHQANALVANNGTLVVADDLTNLLKRNRQAGTFVRDNFTDVFYDEGDCEFLDNTYANSLRFEGTLRHSIILAALCRAAMKKRPRGIFTFTGRKGWDGRRDLAITMRDQFVEAIAAINGAVFTNGKRNRAMNRDVFDIDPAPYDLVYFDPPYVSPHSDCDYTRRYHFVEGLSVYWKDKAIDQSSLTKKFPSYATAFSSKKTVHESFARLFRQFRKSTIVVSYGSNGIPSKTEMIQLIRAEKRKVLVYEVQHKYSFGNHKHKVGDNRNAVTEYVFIGR